MLVVALESTLGSWQALLVLKHWAVACWSKGPSSQEGVTDSLELDQERWRFVVELSDHVLHCLASKGQGR